MTMEEIHPIPSKTSGKINPVQLTDQNLEQETTPKPLLQHLEH
jgi:hypothetical protein